MNKGLRSCIAVMLALCLTAGEVCLPGGAAKAMRVQHNVASMNAYRNYVNNTDTVNKNLEKLSSGYMINRAGDDAAGLAISEKMRVQIQGLEAAQKSAKDEMGKAQTAEGALTEVHSMLDRMSYLVEQSAGTAQDGNAENSATADNSNWLREQIELMKEQNPVNGNNANLSAKALKEKLSSSLPQTAAADTGIGLAGTDLTMKDILTEASDARNRLGAYQNRLEHAINNLGVMEEAQGNALSQSGGYQNKSALMSMLGGGSGAYVASPSLTVPEQQADTKAADTAADDKKGQTADAKAEGADGASSMAAKSIDDYKDKESVTYGEAGQVLTNIGVMEGYADDHPFNSLDTLNMGKACEIIARLLRADVNAIAPSSWDDVQSDWAFQFCESIGIISGYGDGQINPDDPVSGAGFAKMLLVALGYDAEVENLSESEWSQYITQLDKPNIKAETSFETSSVSRDEAAQHAFDAIKTLLVNYDGGSSDQTISLEDAAQIIIAAVTATADSADEANDLLKNVFGEDFSLPSESESNPPAAPGTAGSAAGDIPDAKAGVYDTAETAGSANSNTAEAKAGDNETTVTADGTFTADTASVVEDGKQGGTAGKETKAEDKSHEETQTSDAASTDTSSGSFKTPSIITFKDIVDQQAGDTGKEDPDELFVDDTLTQKIKKTSTDGTAETSEQDDGTAKSTDEDGKQGETTGVLTGGDNSETPGNEVSGGEGEAGSNDQSVINDAVTVGGVVGALSGIGSVTNLYNVGGVVGALSDGGGLGSESWVVPAGIVAGAVILIGGAWAIIDHQQPSKTIGRSYSTSQLSGGLIQPNSGESDQSDGQGANSAGTPCEVSGHVAGEPGYENVVARTCTAGGGYDLVTRCKVCGDILESRHVTLEAMGHRREPIGGYPATCEADGLTGGLWCPDCETVFENRQTIPATGHTWGAWEVVTPATTIRDGLEIRVCQNNPAHTEERAIPKLVEVHVHSAGRTVRTDITEATCKAGGSYRLDVYCAGCGELIRSETFSTEKNPQNHTGETEIRNAVTATCKTEGYSGDTYCLGCEAMIEKGKSTGKNPSNHEGNTEIRGAVTATCKTEGYTGDTYCLGCGAMIGKGKSTGLNASNHEGDTEIRGAVTATCKTEGYTGDTYCLGCGAMIGKGKSTGLNASNHEGDTEIRGAVTATCKTDGYTGNTCCAGCDAILQYGTNFGKDATNHEGDRNVIYYVETNDGYAYYVTCGGCGEIIETGITPFDDMTVIPEFGPPPVVEEPVGGLVG